MAAAFRLTNKAASPEAALFYYNPHPCYYNSHPCSCCRKAPGGIPNCCRNIFVK